MYAESYNTSLLEDQGANRVPAERRTSGACCKGRWSATAEATAGRVFGVDCALGWLCMEAKGGGEGCKGLIGAHGRLRDALGECAVSVGQGPGQARLCHRLKGPLECEGKQQQPTLGVDHHLSL